MDEVMRTIRWEEQDGNGNVIASGEENVPWEPLHEHQVIAALNAVLGIWTLQDAANAAGTTPEHLVAEVNAWAAAQALYE